MSFTSEKTKEQLSEIAKESLSQSLKSKSLWADARRRFLKNRAALGSLVILFIITLFVIFAPMLSPHEFDFTDWGMTQHAPDFASKHYFGTDFTGRDIFVRTAQGGRISLMIGFSGALIAVIVGSIYGAVSGYFGGTLDTVMMRFIEIMQSIPFMFLVIVLMVVFQDGLTIFGFFIKPIIMIFVAVGLVAWLDIARIVRGQTLSIKQKTFIEAAQVVGATKRTVIFKHLIPNVLGVVIVYASLLVPSMILTESFLSFLGLGVQEPNTSWGALLNEGTAGMEVAWWGLVFPAFFMMTTLFCFNYIGDGLRDALDPKDR